MDIRQPTRPGSLTSVSTRRTPKLQNPLDGLAPPEEESTSLAFLPTPRPARGSSEVGMAHPPESDEDADGRDVSRRAFLKTAGLGGAASSRARVAIPAAGASA